MRVQEKREDPDTHSVWWTRTVATWNQHTPTPGDAQAAAGGKTDKREISVKS